MRRTTIRIAISAALIGLGWAAGRAQPAQPDFELFVDAPAGETIVECRRGCELLWVERGVNPGARRLATFSFKCGSAADARCSSGRVGGWRTP
jgi:hypothetical protein